MDNFLKKNYFKRFFLILIISLVLLFSFFSSLPDNKLHLIFCNVGQGEAIFLKTPKGEDILIDGGPNERVLNCLGRHMPFYDRKIEIVILSHPQADHLNGLLSVIERYNIDYFVSNGLEGETQGYKKLVSLLDEKQIKKKIAFEGGKIILDNLELASLWPKEEIVKVLAESTPNSFTQNINEFSLVLKLSFGQFEALLTGDAGQEVLEKINIPISDPFEVLKVPHHGSKTGLTQKILEKIKPQLAVISVGKNSYGHPAKEILNLLESFGIKILRTDQDGEIEIVSDGKNWWVN